MNNLILFSESLNELMLEHNVKPVDIHRDTGINLAVIYAWLNKASSPSINSLVVLSNYFSCSVDYLCGYSEINNYSTSKRELSFEKRLRYLMNKKGVSVRELSANTKIARSAVSYFLSGKMLPLLDNLIKLALFFECSIDYLLGLSDNA